MVRTVLDSSINCKLSQSLVEQGASDIANAFVDKGSVIEIPVSAADADGNPLQLTFAGLPRFATYSQNP